MKIIDRAAKNEYRAEQIEGGYRVYSLNGTTHKDYKESTFKKYFKVIEGDTPEQVNPQPEARKHENDTAAQSESVTAEKREKMIEKIKKMLALAENNPSMEEGLAAALQAHKLMAKYNIHEDDVTLEEIKDEILSVFSTQPHDSHLMGWRKPLGKVVATSFRCKCYLSGKDIVFRGYKDDAKLAMDVYLMLYAVGHKLAKKEESRERTRSGSAKGIYTSVVSGFVKGAEDAFNEQCTALLVVTPKQVEEDWVEFSGNFKTTKSHLTISDYEAYNKGYAEGKQTVKARSITSKRKK